MPIVPEDLSSLSWLQLEGWRLLLWKIDDTYVEGVQRSTFSIKSFEKKMAEYAEALAVAEAAGDQAAAEALRGELESGEHYLSRCHEWLAGSHRSLARHRNDRQRINAELERRWVELQESWGWGAGGPLPCTPCLTFRCLLRADAVDWPHLDC